MEVDENLSAHFKRSEVACRCGCGFDELDPRQVAALEEFRGHVGAPVIVLSGCRCETHNRKVGGKPNSTHLPRNGKGRATDVTVRGWKPEALKREAEKVDAFRLGGIGVYSWGVHLDVGKGPRRW